MKKGSMGGLGVQNINFEERKSIKKLVSLGWTIGAIAKSIGRSHAGIKQELKRNGGRAAYNAEKAQEACDAIQRASILKKQKGFTHEQIKIIQSGLNEGKGFKRICEDAKISNYMFRCYLNRNNIKMEKRNYATFINRIEALEQQLEIVFDILKTNNMM